MITYSKRRGRRSLAAILAAMLMASVLAVVAGTPAQAANTASEYLVDHDDDPSTAMVREFEGRDRYETAALLAKRFAEDRGGKDSVSNAFVASGESLVDAVSVAGLAGFMDAPVLLTRPGSLNSHAKEFLEDYGVANIIVLGGEGAVSRGVFEALQDLVHSPNVDRIQGDNRYATSAAIASHLQGESWCGTNANSAIVASGADGALFDAVAIGPVANRLELPVLLTAGDELVEEVLTYIDANDIEHVVIVGSEANVSADVQDALEAAAVDVVQRLGGNSAAETSVQIAKAMHDMLDEHKCGDDLSPVSTSTVALVNANNVVDGITAAPVLADDTDQLGGGLIPILAVGDTLPPSVRDYLNGTADEDDAGNKLHLRVLAVGGTAAVSDAVMTAAYEAAASADQLTVTIGTGRIPTGETACVSDGTDEDGKPIVKAGGECLFLSFNDDISRAANANLRNKLEDILQVNHVPADVEDTSVSDGGVCDPDGVPVQLERTLKAGDRIDIVQGSVLIGAHGDQRTVKPTFAIVPSPQPDRTRPSIRIIAITGHSRLYAQLSDNVGLDATKGLLAGSLTDSDGDDLFEVTSGDAELAAPVSSTVTPGLVVFEVQDDGGNSRAIKSTDRFRANRGAAVDSEGNESQVTTGVPVKPVSKLQVTSVRLGDPSHTQNAMALIPAAWGTGADGETAPTAPGVAATPPGVWLQAKGPAAGAFGNNWTIGLDRASTHDVNKDAALDVFVSIPDQRILVRVVNGEPTFEDLKNELEGDSRVSERFDVIIDNKFGDDPDTEAVETDADLCVPAEGKIRHDDLPEIGDESGAEDDDRVKIGDGYRTGVTSRDITVTFNGWVESMTAEQSGRLVAAVVDDVWDRFKQDDDTTTLAAVLALLGAIDTANPIIATTNQNALSLGAIAVSATTADDAGPMRSRTITVTTRNAAALPQARDLVEIPDGFDKHLEGANEGDPIDADAATAGVQRQDTDQSTGDPAGPGVTSIADGYGDNAADGSENDFNYGSERRIGS